MWVVGWDTAAGMQNLRCNGQVIYFTYHCVGWVVAKATPPPVLGRDMSSSTPGVLGAGVGIDSGARALSLAGQGLG